MPFEARAKGVKIQVSSEVARSLWMFASDVEIAAPIQIAARLLFHASIPEAELSSLRLPRTFSDIAYATYDMTIICTYLYVLYKLIYYIILQLSFLTCYNIE